MRTKWMKRGVKMRQKEERKKRKDDSEGRKGKR